MTRRIRYQGAIIRDDHILLIKHRHHSDGRSYWLIPGGGREAGETEHECIRREMMEETNLEVSVERLLLDEPGPSENVYLRLQTYLCKPIGGEARPGFEPEPEASSEYAISEVKWFDLRDETSWGPDLEKDPFTYPLMQKIRESLGYPSK